MAKFYKYLTELCPRSTQFAILSASFGCIMHQSFVTTVPHLWAWAGDSRANMRGSDLLSSPTVPGKCWVVILCKCTPMEFIIIIKSRAMSLSRSPQCGAFSRAGMDEKSVLSPLFPIDGGGCGSGVGGSGYK